MATGDPPEFSQWVLRENLRYELQRPGNIEPVPKPAKRWFYIDGEAVDHFLNEVDRQCLLEQGKLGLLPPRQEGVPRTLDAPHLEPLLTSTMKAIILELSDDKRQEIYRWLHDALDCRLYK